MKELAKKLQIKDQEGWYHVTESTLREHGAKSLLEKYNHSPSKLLATVFPQYQWDVTRFTRVPSQYWDNRAAQRAFMDNLAKELNIQDMEGWYTISWEKMVHHGGAGLLQRCGHSPSKLLAAIYPEYLHDDPNTSPLFDTSGVSSNFDMSHVGTGRVFQINVHSWMPLLPN